MIYVPKEIYTDTLQDFICKVNKKVFSNDFFFSEGGLRPKTIKYQRDSYPSSFSD
jgi:hypothetical protein